MTWIKCVAEKRTDSRHISFGTQHEIERIAVKINAAIQIFPLATDAHRTVDLRKLGVSSFPN